MTGQGVTVLRRYQYDPLDRVAGYVSLNQVSGQLFYRDDRMATEIQGQKQYSFFEHGTQVLAQQQREAGKVECALQATDLQGSVLHSVAVGQHQQMVYSPYGYRSPESGLISLKGFNGERRDPVTGLYLLGNGHRPFSTVLMRFICPDRLSPFGKGGVNTFAYCAGDPVNRVDPNGRFFAPALVTGMSQGAFAHRVFSIVDTAISMQKAIAGRVTRVVHESISMINSLRPSHRALARLSRANTERLDSISEFTKLQRHTTDSPPFANTINYVEDAKSAVKNFVGPRFLENGPAPDFRQLLENEALARATLKRVATDYENLQVARSQMNSAIRNWQSETGVRLEDLNGVQQQLVNIRR